jgi:hypothetical protein
MASKTTCEDTMSIKIHDGYRLAEGTNPFGFIRRVRAVMDPLRDEADAGMIAKKATQVADLRWLRQQPVAPTHAFTVYSSWEDEQRKLPEESRDKDPHGFELSIGEDPQSGRLLVRLFTKLPALKTAFEAIEGVEPYSYWSNGDAAKDVTAGEWEQRAAVWARVMPDYAPPAEHMLSFVLRTEANPRAMMLCAVGGGVDDLVLSRIPDRESRALKVATHSYLVHLMSKDVPLSYGLKATAKARDSGLLQPLAKQVEPHLWDIDQDLLLRGSGERPSASAELVARLEEGVAAVRLTLQEQPAQVKK